MSLPFSWPLAALVKRIRTKGRKYGLDGNKIGLWYSSDACDIAIKGLRPDNNGFEIGEDIPETKEIMDQTLSFMLMNSE